MRMPLPLFRTPVDVPPLSPLMSASDGTVLLGSCFAERVGERFVEARLPAVVNPFGVLYNPASIAATLRLGERSLYDEVEVDGVWYSWGASSVVSGHTREECRAAFDAATSRLAGALASAQRLFITLGTNRCYKRGGRVVANCHKVPAREFVEYDMGVEEIVAVLSEAFAHIAVPHIVLTVSPYRYRKYGFHGSQVGKATLLLAVEALCHRFEGRVAYFPAYEIVMDELRDYRFYAADMLHPSPEAVAYIWQRLTEEWMDSDMQAYLREAERRQRSLAHRLIVTT